MESIAEKLSNWALQLQADVLPENVRQTLRSDLIDAGGLMVAGRQRSYINATVNSIEASGHCTAIGHASGFTSADAALVSGIAVHGEDFDDTFEGTPVHVGAVVVPAVLAACEQRELTGEDLLRGLAAGGELACRMALVAPTAIHRAAFHPTAVIGAMAAAFGVGTAARLQPHQLVNALGIAGSMASGIIEYLAEGTSTKRLHAGWAAQSGLRAVALADKGFDGPRTVFEGEHGFYRAFASDTIERDYSRMTDQLGSHWELASLAFKPYACGTMVQPFIDAALALREQVGDLNSIERIDVPTSEAIVHRLWEPLREKRRPSTAYSAKFSVPYGISVALMDGNAGLEQFTDDRIRDKALLALAQKIHYSIDKNDPYPDNYVGAVCITQADGKQTSASQPFMRGGRHGPLERDEIIAKFRANTTYGGWSSATADAYLEFCDQAFESLPLTGLDKFRI